MAQVVKVYVFGPPGRKGTRHYSHDRTLLNNMLSMRMQGMSYDALAVVYGPDKTSIYHQCKRYGVLPESSVIGVDDVLAEIKKEASKWSVVDGERINRGKSYAEYLKDKAQRPTRPL